MWRRRVPCAWRCQSCSPPSQSVPGGRLWRSGAEIFSEQNRLAGFQQFTAAAPAEVGQGGRLVLGRAGRLPERLACPLCPHPVIVKAATRPRARCLMAFEGSPRRPTHPLRPIDNRNPGGKGGQTSSYVVVFIDIFDRFARWRDGSQGAVDLTGGPAWIRTRNQTVMSAVRCREIRANSAFPDQDHSRSCTFVHGVSAG